MVSTYVSNRNGKVSSSHLKDLPNVVFVVIREGRNRNIVARIEIVFIGIRADVFVASEHEVDIPFVGPVFDEVDDFVEMLVVIDEDGCRLFVAIFFCDLIDEV